MPSHRLNVLYCTLLFLLGCSTAPHLYGSAVQRRTAAEADATPIRLFYTPSEENIQPILDEIARASKIRMIMFHMKDKEVLDSLVDARKRGADIQIIVDQRFSGLPPFAGAIKKLRKAGIQVKTSSSAFNTTHAKTMVFDDTRIFVTSINLMEKYQTTRDFGLILTDPLLVSDFLATFALDWDNADHNTGNSPATLQSSRFVLSPVNSTRQLSSLIGSAKQTIIAMVENLGDEDIQSAFLAASARGVKVRLLVPEKTEAGVNSGRNEPFMKQLAEGHVEVRVMPDKKTPEMPYIHAKMILADDVDAYIGSENFSRQSLKDSREMGLVFSDREVGDTLNKVFARDWGVSRAFP